MTTGNYCAFISYSHADERWAKWLHAALENYRVPKQLIGRTTAQGPVPARLRPVFRDRDELPGSPRLADAISDALARSKTLIVLCSPRAAVSRYVNSEIVTFKRRSRDAAVLCLLIDGEPNASDSPGSGMLEAFPAAIRFEVDAAGELTDTRVEPLAADVRPGKDSREDAKLKIVAGMLGVGFDELKQRESRRRLQRRLQTAAAGLAVIGAIGGLWWNRHEVVEAQRESALSKELAAKSREYAVSRPDLSSLLAVAAFDVSDTGEAREALFASAGGANVQARRFRDLAIDQAAVARFSADGKALALGGNKGQVTLWDTAAGRKMGGHQAHADAVTALAFSPVAGLIASGSGDGTVVLWDSQARKVRLVLDPALGRVFDVAFSDDGSTIRTMSLNGAILWRVSDGSRLRVIPASGLARNKVILNSDGTRVGISGDWLQVWDADTDKLLTTIKPPAGRFIEAFAFASDRRKVTTIDNQGDISEWEAETGRRIRDAGVLPASSRHSRAVTIGADAGIVADIGTELTVHDLRTSKTTSYPLASGGGNGCFAVAGDGSKIAWCGRDGVFWLLDRMAMPFRATFETKDRKTFGDVAFNRDGTWLASGDLDGRVVLSHLDGSEKGVLKTDGLSVSSIAFGADYTIAVGVRHGPVTVWKGASADLQTKLPEGGGIIGSQVVFSHDGSILVSATHEKISLWDAETWQRAGEITNPATVRRMASHPSAAVLACANSDGTVTIWNLRSKVLLGTLQAHKKEVMGIAFSADGKLLASAGRDGTVVIWDSNARAPLRRFDALDEIYSIAFSPDGRLLAHGSDNGRIVIRDVETFQPLVTMHEHSSSVSSLAFRPDGRSLASSSGKSMIMWNVLDLAAWRARACMNAGRNLTRDEWQLFLGDRRASALCPDQSAATQDGDVPATTRK